ncbi:MAG TPA: LysE family transporter [Candidatus Anoxymicrobiaceae bacterium]
MGALIGIFFSSMLIGLSGALMPGPMFTVCVAESYKKGFWAGPLMVVGHAIPEIALAVLFSIGLNKFLDDKTVVGVIGIVGGLFLGWLAVKIFVEVRRGVTVDLTSKKDVGWGPLVAGIWTSVSNPGWIVWWATIGARYILLSLDHGIIGVVFFLVGHEMADLVWYGTVSFLVSRGRGRISDRIYHGVLYACSFLVLVFAVLFLVNGIRSVIKG